MPPTQQNFNTNQAGLNMRSIALPNFLQSPIALPQDIYQPQAVQTAGLDPYARLATDTYNQQLQDYARSQQNAVQAAETSRQGLANQFNVTANIAEQQRLAGGNNARQNYQDTLLQTRNRARALGAGNSSGYLDLASRADRTLSNNIMGINTQADQVVGQASLNAQEQLGKLEQDLRSQIAQIESDRRLSLRQKDAAILDAQTRAAQNALRIGNVLGEEAPVNYPGSEPGRGGAAKAGVNFQIPDQVNGGWGIGEALVPGLAAAAGFSTARPIAKVLGGGQTVIPYLQQRGAGQLVNQVANSSLADPLRRGGDVLNSFFGGYYFPGFNKQY